MELKNYLVTKKDEIKSLQPKPRKISIEPNINFIISIIGPRRVGKTFFLYYLLKKFKLKNEDFIFLNFEEIIPKKDVEKFLNLIFLHQEIYGKIPKFLFFDEIQALENWERLVYFFYEKKKFFYFPYRFLFKIVE